MNFISGKLQLRVTPILGALASACLLAGCANVHRTGLPPEQAQAIIEHVGPGGFSPSQELKRRILALDPDNVTAADVRDVLSRCPAPRVINIHGGIHPVQYYMVSFSEFLMGMGYPGRSITNPGDGTYSFSCYEDAEKIAGCVAWYYEHEAMRPMMVGHSQGGMQAVKVLHKLAGHDGSRMHVWNPVTWERERRCEITDPFTGQSRAVTSLSLSYVTSVGAGGLTRLLPNQWDMNLRLRDIPDSVGEFTGFCKGGDIVGGDMLGYGSANEYEAMHLANVRNVWLPASYSHREMPITGHLAKNSSARDWIDRYRASDRRRDHLELKENLSGETKNILWAADVWFSIKRNWVRELQTLVRTERLASLPATGAATKQ